MLTMRMIGVNDYGVHDDDQPIGRIRLARECPPSTWLRNVVVTIPAPDLIRRLCWQSAAATGVGQLDVPTCKQGAHLDRHGHAEQPST
ncbi:MAG: hypothetical protein ACM3JD_00485 [Rudaea sp.]